MSLSISVGLGVGAGGSSPLKAVLNLDFTSLAVGALASLPGGLSFSRASSATVQTGTNTVVTTGITNDVARVGQLGGINVLWFEGSTVNLFSNARAPQSWPGAPSNGTTTGNSTQGPDGQTLAALHAINSGGFSRYQTSTTLYTSGQTHTASAWFKQGSSATYSHNLADAASHGGGGALASGWNRYSITFTPSGTSGAYIVAEGRDTSAAGGIAAGARNFYSDLHQLEAGRKVASSWISGTRAGERIWAPAASVVSKGRVRFRAKWTALHASSQMPFNGRLWTIDANNFVEIDANKLQVRTVAGGKIALLPTVLSWTAGDVIEMRVDVGNGTPSGWYSLNGGPKIDLGSGIAQGPVLAEGASLDILCNGTAAQLEGGLQALTFYGTGTSTVPTVYASPTGSGVGSLADPASITQAQTLSRVLGPGSRVVIRGGRYELAAPLAFTAADNGITWIAYPGETPILSGGKVITGSWTGPDGSGVYSKSFSGHTRHLTVGGQRCIRARSALQSGWTKTAGGWTASDATIAGYAHPEDVEIVGSSTGAPWKQFRGFVASASGTAITMRNPDWAQAQDAPAGAEWNTVWWYEGVPELVANGQGYWAHDRHSNTLYYKPRPGETMGSVEVIAGNLEEVVTVTGTLDAPVMGLSFIGITFADATWLEPDSQGYAPIQTGIVGSGYVNGSYHKTPAAVKVVAGHNITIAGCTFQHMGAVGLSLDYGSQDNLVMNCLLSDIGSAAITVGDVSSTTDYQPVDMRSTVSRNQIVSCRTYQTGRDYWGSAAIFAGYVDHLSIDHCEIDETRYSGICIGWGWGLRNASPLSVSSANAVTGCKITNWGKRDSVTLKQMADMGGIYFNGPMAGATISGNHVKHDGTYNAGVTAYSLYLDNAAEGVLVTGNAVENSTWASIQFSVVPYAINNTVTGNYGQNVSALGPYDPSNTVTGNTIGTFGSTANAIVTASGRL
ncbi:MAG: right-handed parallel beta-helix repeat-containing protein [Minicystis sp.]